MAQVYSDPSRENDPHALPDIEVFYHIQGELMQPEDHGDGWEDETNMLTGWYYWVCFPGCLPDSEPCGPYETEAEAIADAQQFAAA